MSETMNKDYDEQPLDHDGHAACVLIKYPDMYRHTGERGWLVYRNGYWQTKGAEASVTRAIKNVLREREQQIIKDPSIENEKARSSMRRMCKANNGTVIGVRAMIKSFEDCECSILDFDNNPKLINCKNGVVNLETGKLAAHSALLMFTYRLNVDYEKGAKNETWDTFLATIGMDDDTLNYLRILSGYCLTGLTREELMFYLYGETRTGKGTFTNALLGVLGLYGMGINFRTFTVRRDGDTQNFDLAILSQKRFLSASESKRHERINASVFKQVTGGDPIFAAYKGKDGFSFIPQWKIMLSSNYPLNADPMDSAVWARVRVLKFGKSNLGKEDKTLKAKLDTDGAKEAILAWAVSGAVEWFSDGLNTPANVTENTHKMRLEVSSVLIFIDQCCTLGIDKTSDGKALYSAYIEWAIGEGYHKPYGRMSFTQALERLGCKSAVRKVSGKSTRYYTNIKFLGDAAGDLSISNRIELDVF